ncbi:MAG: tetratricopeptide repeat protein [Phycisphaerae bacterium]
MGKRSEATPRTGGSWAVAAVMLAAAALYAQTLRPDFDFVNLDDPQYILHNPFVRVPTLDHLKLLFRPGELLRPTGVAGYAQPLTIASLMLDGWLSGAPQRPPNPAVFHLTNLILHTLNGALVFWLMRRLGAAAWPAAALALLFVCHPVQVESVAWVSQRKSLLSAFFALLSTLAYLQLSRGAARWRWLGLAMVTYVAAVLAKPTALPLPLVFLLLDAWPLQRFSARSVIEKLPLLLLMVAGATLAAVSQGRVGNLDAPLAASPMLWGRLILHNVASLLTRIAWPVDLVPNVPGADATALTMGRTLFEASILGALIVGAIVAVRRAPVVGAALGAYFLMIAPATGVVRFTTGLAGDRFNYLPLVFLLMPMAVLLSRRSMARRGSIAVAAIALGLGVASFAQIRVWRDGGALFQHVLAIHPDHVAARVGLADWLMIHGRAEEAAPLLEQAVQAEPENGDHRYYWGNALRAIGRPEDAIAQYRMAAASDPDRATYLQALGGSLAKLGRFEDALPHYERARERSPRSALIRLGLGYTDLGLRPARPASARAEFQIALEMQPDNPMIHLGLANAWALMDMPDQARAHLAAAVAMDPVYAERAGREPALRSLADRPEFAGLIESAETKAAGEAGLSEGPG